MISGNGPGGDLEPRATRRRLIGALAVAAPGLTLGVASAAAQRDDATPVADDERAGEEDVLAQANAPEWAIQLTAFQDPYEGQIQAPQDPPAGVRFVAIEVVIDNSSDQPLNFSPINIRVADATGTEYRGGQAAGTEPFLGERNLNGGDRSRGWVWFMVPENAQLAELIYEAPRPLFRIPIAEAGS